MKDKGTDELRGLFEGGSFPNAQINILTGDGVQISYQSAKKEEKPEDSHKIKDNIMEYVGRLKPLVKPEYADKYDDLWTEILELEEVKVRVYNKGKQQDTTFNRNFVAQLIHQISPKIYLPEANSVVMAEHLEPARGVNHSVRPRLKEAPEKVVKKSIDNLLKEK